MLSPQLRPLAPQAAADSVGTGGAPGSYAAEAPGSSLALRLGIANPGVRIGLAAGSFLGVVLLLQGLSGSGGDEVRGSGRVDWCRGGVGRCLGRRLSPFGKPVVAAA